MPKFLREERGLIRQVARQKSFGFRPVPPSDRRQNPSQFRRRFFKKARIHAAHFHGSFFEPTDENAGKICNRGFPQISISVI